jgi:uncharacterized protein (DUF1499 family)
MLWAVLIGLLVPVVFLVGSVVASWNVPANLGIRNGRLTPCPGTPNCECSESGDPSVPPFPVTDAASDWKRLKGVMSAFPHSRLLSEANGYLWYECRTPLVGFADDVEFRLDAESDVIHVRSASRIGRSDLGANRKRIERIRALYSVTK